MPRQHMTVSLLANFDSQRKAQLLYISSTLTGPFILTRVFLIKIRLYLLKL